MPGVETTLTLLLDAVAEGKLRPDGLFIADNILAKHDERYMPPQMGNQAAEMATRETLR